MLRSPLRLALACAAAGVILSAILALAVLPYLISERAMVRQKIIERDADILYPEALQQVQESEAASPGSDAADLLWPVLKTAEQKGMFAVTIFDGQGEALHSVPASLLLPEIAPEDFAQALAGNPISHYDPAFPLSRYFAGLSGTRVAPVLEVLLPLTGSDPNRILGFAQYYIDAHGLATELREVDAQLNRAALRTVGLGIALIAGLLVVAYAVLARAQRAIAERNERLTRANFELALAAKVSALGQITSDLIHGLQGPVAGLRALTAAAAPPAGAEEGWRSVAGYAERLQTMIQETIGLLGDIGGGVSYELTGDDLAQSILRRTEADARGRSVELSVRAEPALVYDNRRAGLICLIATNLIQNAVAVTPAGRSVDVRLVHGEGAGSVLTVQDQGRGIAEEARSHLFEPGRSTRPGGTGLGLAISRLLARQLGGDLELRSTGPDGSVFRLMVPPSPR